MRTDAHLLSSSDWRCSWLDAWPCDLPSTVPYPQAPLWCLLRHIAGRLPDHPACTLYGQVTSYAELNDQANRLAGALARLGARPGRHIGLLLPNIPEYLVALQAVWLTGATALQLSPLMVAEEIDHWIEATGCHLVVTLDLLAPVVTGTFHRGPLEHVVLTSLARRMALWRGLLYYIERLRRNGYLRMPDDDHRHPFDGLLHGEPLPAPVEVDPAEAVAVVAPTGGTTAASKAVMLTHRNLLANAMQLREWYGGTDGTEGVLALLPFFHAYGLSVSLLSAWAGGCTMHLHPRFEARATLEILRTHRPALMPAVPAMLAALNRVIGAKKPDLSFVRAVISGASALHPEVRAAFEATGVGEIVEGYGLTEASPVTHVNPPGAGNRPGAIGLPVADTFARVIDPDTGATVAAGQVGELVVRGPQVMKGYFNHPDATAAILRDGWLFTGDMVRQDDDGYAYLVDRKRDLIKTSGFLVFPAEVEELLRQHPQVSDAAVIGIPDRDRGEIVKALVIARDGEQIDVEDLAAYCKTHLGKPKRPQRFEVVTELPRNFLGKVLRRKLREAAPA